MPLINPTFRLTIKLGNDAMSTGDDIARALCKLADALDRTDEERGAIMDDNGNKVGQWAIGGELP